MESNHLSARMITNKLTYELSIEERWNITIKSHIKLLIFELLCNAFWEESLYVTVIANKSVQLFFWPGSRWISIYRNDFVVSRSLLNSLEKLFPGAGNAWKSKIPLIRPSLRSHFTLHSNFSVNFPYFSKPKNHIHGLCFKWDLKWWIT